MEIRKTVVSYDELNALREALGRYSIDHPAVYVHDRWDRKDRRDILDFEVNWSAMGAQKPEVALQYARDLVKSANIAKLLEMMNISVDRSLPEIETVEDWEATKQMWLDIIEKA